jgi:hypothetical protein
VAVRSLADLESALDEGLAWRRIEISALRGSLRDAARQNADAPLARALRRSSVALGYAHWEGYGREAFSAYADYLKRKRLRLAEVNDGLLLSCLMLMARKAKSSPDVGRDALIEMVRRLGDARIRLPLEELTDTKGNLRFRVLERIMSGLGLEMTDFEMRRNWIDVVLCDQRNSIAHGRGLCPSVLDALEIVEEVLSLMERLRDAIVGSARSLGYLAPNADLNSQRQEVVACVRG